MPGHDPSRFISPSALMISMGANLVRERVAGREALAGFDVGSEAFQIRLHDGQLHIPAVASPEARFVLSGSGNALAVAVYGKTPLKGLIRKKIVAVNGDIEAAQAFVDLFELKC